MRRMPECQAVISVARRQAALITPLTPARAAVTHLHNIASLRAAALFRLAVSFEIRRL